MIEEDKKTVKKQVSAILDSSKKNKKTEILPDRIDLSVQKEIIEILSREYADTKAALNFSSSFQLLIAVILSAQSNDNQVNKITEKLFADYPDPWSIAQLNREDLEQYIRTCGLYKNKAKNILAACQMLCQKYNGQVPCDRELLMELPGVGRKTANVVLSVGFEIPALAVDTHVFRVSRRLGLSRGANPDAVEKDLCDLIMPQKWGQAHHWLIWHGRKVCSAPKPKCSLCSLVALCPSYHA